MAVSSSFRFSLFPLKKRFTISISIMLLLLVILSVSGYFFQQTVIHAFEEAKQEAVDEMHSLSHLQVLVLQAAMPANDYLVHGQAAEQQLANKFHKEVKQSFDRMLKVDFALGEERDLVAKAKGTWEVAWQMADELLATSNPIGNMNAALLMEQFDTEVALVVTTLQEAYDLACQELHKELENAYKVKNELLMFTVILLFAGLALTLFVGSALSRSVLEPIRLLMEGAGRFGKGELDYRVEISGNDELTELSNIFNEMAADIEESHRRLEEMSQKDGLTGLYNNRMFVQVLQENVERFQRYASPFSVLMMDLDHFKNVNDTYGHLAGDDVLKEVASALGKQVRIVDHVARYGGEEMAVILTEITVEAAMAKAEQIRQAVAGLQVAVSESKTIGVTVSIGVASCPGDAEDGQALIACADKALYAAKNGGRNRVVHCADVAAEELQT